MFSHPDIKEPDVLRSSEVPALSFSLADFEAAIASPEEKLIENQLKELLVFFRRAEKASVYIDKKVNRPDDKTLEAYLLFVRAMNVDKPQNIDDLCSSVQIYIQLINEILQEKTFDLLKNNDHLILKFLKSLDKLHESNQEINSLSK